MDKADHSPRDEHETEIWTYLKSHPRVTRSDILAACGVSEHRTDRFLRRLKRAGILRFDGREGSHSFLTVFRTGDVLARAAEKRQTPEAAIWQAMRTLTVFTVDDLSVALALRADITRDAIRKYALMLARSKYLATVQRGSRTGSAERWRLIRDTGPLPPKRKRMAVVIDANEDRIVYARGERI